MNNKERLYQKYITDECDDSEVSRMSEELKQFDLEEYENESLRDFDEELGADLSRRLLTNVQYEIAGQRKNRRRRVLRVAGAILIFGFIFGVWRFNIRQDYMGAEDLFAESKTAITNDSDTTAVLNLPDHSIVYLKPHSDICYYTSFNASERNIFLHGEAIFSVSKDHEKPFNVFTGRIVTTAIGTKFKVSERQNNIFIKLLEGKIVVRKTMIFADPHFLIAGNSINYNIESDLFTSILRTADHKNRQLAKTGIPTVPTLEKKVITLNNEPLSDALDQIAQKYNVEIEYSPKDIDDINIIATLDPSKPVYHVLHNIALMNNLRILELGDKQYILDRDK